MEISFPRGYSVKFRRKRRKKRQILAHWRKKPESITVLEMLIVCQAGDRRFRNYGAGKLKQAMDLDLDKDSGSKYSLNLGGFVQQSGKVTTKWRRNTMGLMPLSRGEDSRAFMYGCLRDALGECAQRRFF